MADIRGTILNLTRNLSKTSGDLVKTTKLSVSLAQEQEALRNLYTEIGKKVHEIYQYGGSLGKFFDEKYREIEAAERKIDELKETLGKIKGVKECPKCNKQMDKTAEFCPKCGFRMDGAPAAAQGEKPEPDMSAFRPPSGYEPPSAAEPVPRSPEVMAATAYTSPAPTAAHPSAAATPNPDFPPEPVAEPLPPVPEPPAVTITAAPEPKVFCRVCGAENSPGTKFCLSCGRIL